MPGVDLALTSRALPSLTGLRWFAAFAVFAYHLMNMQYFGPVGQTVLRWVVYPGGTGVSLFFILSGFVLAWSDNPHVGAVGFYRRRIARIYPLHAATVGLALLTAAFLVPSIKTADPWAVVANLALVSAWYPPWANVGNPVSWTLVCEAFFYLVFPLLIRLLRGASTRRLVTVVITVPLVTAGIAVVAPMVPFISPNSTPAARLPEFTLGIAMACLLRRGAWRGPRIGVALVVLLAGWIAVLLFPSSPFELICFTLPGYALLVPAVARLDVEHRRSLLSGRRLVYAGTLSYAFYLVHLLCLQSLANLFPSAAPALPLPQAVLLGLAAFALAAVLSWTLHVTIERPGRRLLLRRLHAGGSRLRS